jgi:hypothetical protein
MSWKIRKFYVPICSPRNRCFHVPFVKLDLMDAADVELSSSKESPSASFLVVCESVPFPRPLSTYMSF